MLFMAFKESYQSKEEILGREVLKLCTWDLSKGQMFWMKVGLPYQEPGTPSYLKYRRFVSTIKAIFKDFVSTELEKSEDPLESKKSLIE